MSARRSWHVSGDQLVLSMAVEVNGKVCCAQSVIHNDLMGLRPPSPPPKYLERELRRKLMHFIADELLGPEE